MTNLMNSVAYRKAALEYASPVGLIIALYDTLLGNLTRAAAAIEQNDIESRCTDLAHGFKVLQQLEVMVNMDHGGPAALHLRRFYTRLRGQMLAAQFQLSAARLHEQIRALIEVREAWQQIDARGMQDTGSGNMTPHGKGHQARGQAYPPHSDQEVERASFSCSG